MQVGDRGGERVMVFARQRIEVADRGAPVDAACRMDRAAFVRPRLDQRSLGATGMADQRDGTDGFGWVIHGRPHSATVIRPLLVKMARPARRRARFCELGYAAAR